VTVATGSRQVPPPPWTLRAYLTLTYLTLTFLTRTYLTLTYLTLTYLTLTYLTLTYLTLTYLQQVPHDHRARLACAQHARVVVREARLQRVLAVRVPAVPAERERAVREPLESRLTGAAPRADRAGRGRSSERGRRHWQC
jgi:hypothetical protein